MQRYTVGVAGQTVNLLSSGSGGSTPSRCTNLLHVGDATSVEMDNKNES